MISKNWKDYNLFCSKKEVGIIVVEKGFENLLTQKRISFSKKKILKMIKQLLFGLFILSQFSFAQNYGTLRFATYANDRQSAFSLTFDDGLLSQTENVRPILNQYGFKGTFYVLPPYLTETLPGIWRYGTWPAFQSMSLEGH